MLPYPLLFTSLVVFWVLLNDLTPGHLLLGAMVAVFATWSMAALKPAKPTIRRWPLLARFVLMMLLDIARSNAAVATIILGGRKPHPAFVRIKLDIRSEMGLAVLAVVLTSTPGTAWLDYNSADGVLTMHVFDVRDEEEWRRTIKNRYEKPLMEIFG